ncbi:MAG: aspartate--tRNA ligase [Magnetococcales bacterium]|nr:aspartate--tRNA ligase [Magnetococcales bacterium]
MKRTHYCIDVNESLAGQKVVLCGWVFRRRDHGGVIFVDLRDRGGVVQVVFSPEHAPEIHADAHQVRSEFVLRVVGDVALRSPETINPNMETGRVEVIARQLEVLAASKPLPFQLDEEVAENIRLAWRFLDLRRPPMQRAMQARHRAMQATRRFLDENGFLEVETPMLTRSTPEGARDFLVPSRINPGQFYALPQSPQLFKQLLMISGFDRYFQIVRCFRDEDLRADRQPEFTQIDLEMSFVETEDVMAITEGIVAAAFKAVLGVDLPFPAPRIPYAEAMDRFGRDAPDLRVQMELTELTEALRQTGFKVFADAVQRKGYGAERGMIKALRVPGGAALTRKQIDDYTAYVAIYGAKGLAWIKLNAPWQSEGWQSPIVKFFTPEEKEAIQTLTGAQTGDLIFFAADKAGVVNESLGRLRVKVGQDLGLMDPTPFAFAWVTDFPLLEWDPEAKRYNAVHHPFTSPRREDLALCMDNAAAEDGSIVDTVKAQAYDLVLNGTEIGGGSIRIHRSELQKRMLELLRIGPEEAEEKFGFLIKALEYGAPPHGGLALGLDRLMAIMLGMESIRDVIAFPKTQKGSCLLTQAPSPVDPGQLQELHLKLAALAKPKPEKSE